MFFDPVLPVCESCTSCLRSGVGDPLHSGGNPVLHSLQTGGAGGGEEPARSKTIGRHTCQSPEWAAASQSRRGSINMFSSGGEEGFPLGFILCSDLKGS